MKDSIRNHRHISARTGMAKGARMDLIDSLRKHVFADDAQAKRDRYLDPGRFSGAWFDTLDGPGDAAEVANRITPADLVAVSTLSVNISGWAAIDLLDRKADDLSGLLTAVPTDVELHDASDAHVDAVFAVQDALDAVDGIGHVTRSKLLARKRPHLVPVRDQHVLSALIGRDHGPLTRPLRDALRDNLDVRDRLHVLRTKANRDGLSLLRTLDIVVWMRAHGDASTHDT